MNHEGRGDVLGSGGRVEREKTKIMEMVWLHVVEGDNLMYGNCSGAVGGKVNCGRLTTYRSSRQSSVRL